MRIKVMTFNIHHGRGTDGKLSLERTAEAIKNGEADIVALNEVDNRFSKRSGFADQALWLAERLQMHSAFGPAVPWQRNNNAASRQYGNALLSRYPIVSVKNHPMCSGLIEGRSLLESEIVLKDKRLAMYVTHLSLNPVSRKRQIDYIARQVADSPLPVVVAGDWNMKRGGKGWRTMSAILNDCSEAAAAPCLTFPSQRPARQLDYIFASRAVQIAAAEVIRDLPEASDHLPLAAALQLGDSTGRE